MKPSGVRAYVLAPLYYAVALALAILIIANANDASRAYESVSAHETISAKTDRALRDILETLSLGIYGGGTELAEQVSDAVDVAQYHEARATGTGWLLLGFSVAFLAVVIATEERGRRNESPTIIRHLFGVSSIFLLVGLLAPILTVVTTIHKLFLVANYFLASLLLLFSVVLPVLKILLSIVALELGHSPTRRASVLLIKIIGRWSMTDVFVVAVLLAFLTADTAQLTDATLGPGLYFFAGYGLLSIAAGQMMIGYEVKSPSPSVADRH
jgi:hypothetical protein